jgi:hypothetical protein
MRIYNIGSGYSNSRRSSLVRNENWIAAAMSPQVNTRRAAATLIPVDHIGVTSLLLFDKEVNVRSALAERRLSVVALTVLSGDVSENVRIRVAANPATPPDLLKKLTQDESFRVQVEASVNPATLTVDALAGINSLNGNVQKAALPRIAHVVEDADIFLRLVENHLDLVDFSAGRNRSMAKFAVKGGAPSSDAVLQFFVNYVKKITPATIQTTLSAFSATLSTRDEVTLKRLDAVWASAAASCNPEVTANFVCYATPQTMRLMPKTYNNLLANDHPEVQERLLANVGRWKIPPATLLLYGKSRHVNVRAAVARYVKNETIAELELHNDPEPEVRKQVARFAEDPKVITQLLNDPDLKVVKELANNFNIPPCIAVALTTVHNIKVPSHIWYRAAYNASREDWQSLTGDELLWVAKHTTPEVTSICGRYINNETAMKYWLSKKVNRLALMHNSAATSEILHECLARSRDSREYAYLNAHPNLSLEDKVIIAMM